MQERRTAQDLGGRVQKGSGSSDFAKSDVRRALDIRAECKTTSAKSYTLKLSDWSKIQMEALQGGMEAPVMQVEFQGPAGMNKKLAVIDWNYFLELRQKSNKAEELANYIHDQSMGSD